MLLKTLKIFPIVGKFGNAFKNMQNIFTISVCRESFTASIHITFINQIS